MGFLVFQPLDAGFYVISVLNININVSIFVINVFQKMARLILYRGDDSYNEKSA
jgi:hypothetical protein